MSLKSHGLTAWLWLFKIASRAKAVVKPSIWPGLFGLSLAWLRASGQALHSPVLAKLTYLLVGPWPRKLTLSLLPTDLHYISSGEVSLLVLEGLVKSSFMPS
jgi:hypothetical protein